MLVRLRQTFPEAFAHPVPLALGIAAEIKAKLQEPRPPNVHITRALGHWTEQDAYLEAIAAGVPRRHLDGTEAERPDEAHREHARAILARRAERQAERPARDAAPVAKDKDAHARAADVRPQVVGNSSHEVVKPLISAS